MLISNILVLILVHLCSGRHMEPDPPGPKNHSPHVFPDVRIIDGNDAVPHDIPSMVLVTTFINGTLYSCGGSLIDRQFVLTAAHCLAGTGTTVDKIYLGSHKTDQADSRQRLDASRFVLHEQWDGSSGHDVGLVKLATPATLQAGIVETAVLPNAATFPDGQSIYEGKLVTVYGWGLTKQASTTFPTVLQTLDGRIVPYRQCSYAKNARSNTLCMSRLDGAPGNICYGDSGGPLVQDGILIGVASSGSDHITLSCHKSLYGVFARVDYHRKWIYDQMKQMK